MVFAYHADARPGCFHVTVYAGSSVTGVLILALDEWALMEPRLRHAGFKAV